VHAGVQLLDAKNAPGGVKMQHYTAHDFLAFIRWDGASAM